MNDINTGGPAFPLNDALCTNGNPLPSRMGMTLRDYFAAKALPVHMAALATWDAESPDAWQAEVSRLSYATADAMLKARETA